MQIKWFRSVRFKNDWELNFVGKVYNLRIARRQIAFWRNYNPIINWFLPASNRKDFECEDMGSRP